MGFSKCNKRIFILGLLVLGLLWLVFVQEIEGGCGGGCGACTRRFGCMTPAWGKCCSQFFMHNGKRSSEKALGSVPNFIEYIRLKGLINVEPGYRPKGSHEKLDPFLFDDSVEANDESQQRVVKDRNEIEPEELLRSAWKEATGALDDRR